MKISTKSLEILIFILCLVALAIYFTIPEQGFRVPFVYGAF